jgi:tetratricopeptide (TPR) repeat protein
MSETKAVSKRQLTEEARLAAMDGRWEEAISINSELAQRTPKDAAIWNRIGKAQIELGNAQAAIEAYTASLKVDAANMIARQNLQRLEQLRGHGGQLRTRELTNRTNVFIQEVGKTWVDELVNPAALDILADVASGEALKLVVKKGHLIVLRADDVELGEIEPRTAQRVIELMAGGNQYEIFALGQSASGLRVILRESYRSPSQADRVSFPRQISQAGRYLREREVIRQRDEADFYFSDDDEEEIEAETVEETSDSTDDFESREGNGTEFVGERGDDEEDLAI